MLDKFGGHALLGGGLVEGHRFPAAAALLP